MGSCAGAVTQASGKDSGSAPEFGERGLRMSDYLAIRPITRHDYEQWLPLWNGYNAFYCRAGERRSIRHHLDDLVALFDAYEPMHAFGRRKRKGGSSD